MKTENKNVGQSILIQNENKCCFFGLNILSQSVDQQHILLCQETQGKTHVKKLL